VAQGPKSVTKGSLHTNRNGNGKIAAVNRSLAALLSERRGGKAKARTKAHAGNLSVLNILPPLKGLAFNYNE